jgi:hypothetical protein
MHPEDKPSASNLPAPDPTDPTSRRQFIRRVGQFVLSVVVVDVVTTTNPVFAVDPNCNQLLPDANCNATDNPDEHCGIENDQDQSCTTTSQDENCHITTAQDHDKDQNCTATNNHADAACGDPDPAHDTDEHCGKQGPGQPVDTDQLCGHQHFVGIDNDDNCSATVQDVGCGKHKAVYNPIAANDDDQYCVNGNPDANCSAQASDAACSQPPQTWSTAPDEKCGAGDTDEACGIYDSDEACGTAANGSDPDAACNVQAGLLVDVDDNCKKVATDIDESCTSKPPDGQ